MFALAESKPFGRHFLTVLSGLGKWGGVQVAAPAREDGLELPF